jgi:hypothetical protein
MTIWEPDALWEKARLYAARASGEEQEGPLFAFWSILALELLGRTVVASVHPALLADPQSPENLMYAFGLGRVEKPKSVPAATVFRRCRKIVEDFTEADLRGTLALIELRNEELHSGGTPFEGMKTSAWLADYYRLCQLLLESINRRLGDMFGEEQAAAAQQMIEGVAEQLQAEVLEHVAEQRRAFERLDETAREERRSTGAATLKQRVIDAMAPNLLGKVVPCPACSTDAWLSGEFVRAGDPIADEDAIVQEIVKVPTRLDCFTCGLEVFGNGRLHAVDLGGLFAGQMREDPKSYYQIEFDPSEIDLSEYYEPDYGND